MKLTPARTGTSFYESFSDLIFGTLVLFIVLVMGLVVKLQQTVAEQADRPPPAVEAVERQVAQEFVAKNRFTGGTDNTYMYWCSVRRGGEAWVAFFPIELVQTWQLARTPERNPVRTLCDLVVSDGLFMVRETEVAALGRGFGEIRNESWVVYHWELGYTLDRALAERRRLGGAVTTERLTEAVGGLWPDVGGFDEWSAWVGRDSGDGGRMVRLYRQFEAASLATGIAHTRLRFTATETDRGIRVGGLVVSGSAFAALLRSIKPGRGFFVEHLDANGGEVAPPQWVVTEILGPTGFDGRALSAKAERLLETR